MVQQINLCVTRFKPEKQQFAARTLLTLLGVVVVLGGILAGVWLWNLQRSSASYRQTLDTQGGEIQSLQAAIQRSRAANGPTDPLALQQMQDMRVQLQQREKLLEALQQGALRPGEAHSDRLQLVASTIPAPVWVTGVQVASGRFEVSGFTLETAALHSWVLQLSTHPLMRGLKLSNVRVESANQSSRAAATSTGAQAAPVANGRPLWSFTLVSLEPALALAQPAPSASAPLAAAAAYLNANSQGVRP